MRKRIKKAFSEKQIAKRIDKLGATIRKDAGKAEVFLLGVLKGTSFFLADLMRAIPGDVTYGFIDVIRDMADTGPTAMEIDYLQYSDIGGRNVYLLKDVVSTGTGTSAQIPGYQVAGKTGTAQKPDSHGGYSTDRYVASFVGFVPASKPRLVVLVAVDEPEVDFRAFEADHRGSFVGYGLEWEGKHGNLPYIGRV